MTVKALATSMAIGAAVGAVGILMMSRTNPTRKLAAQAADKVEGVAKMVSDKLTGEAHL